MGKSLYKVAMDNNQYYVTSIDSSNRDVTTVTFHIPPESISETPGQPNWNSNDIVGRSAPLRSYSGNGSRAVAFTVKFIDDYHKGNLMDVANSLGSMLYPKYTKVVTEPTKVRCRLGDIVIKGIMTSCTFNWSGPIRGNHRIFLECNITIEESLDKAYGRDEVLGKIWQKL